MSPSCSCLVSHFQRYTESSAQHGGQCPFLRTKPIPTKVRRRQMYNFFRKRASISRKSCTFAPQNSLLNVLPQQKRLRFSTVAAYLSHFFFFSLFSTFSKSSYTSFANTSAYRCVILMSVCPSIFDTFSILEPFESIHVAKV